ncbi:MAG: ribonuclease III family protein [Candidatus Thorarchaeota archaeon]
MDYEFLIKDLKTDVTHKAIGTDKGLSKLGDGIVNFSYSMAKSIYLTKNNPNEKIIRTGLKVSKKILAEALKNANMKSFSKSRADAHDLADTAEALVAYVWLTKVMSLEDIIDFLFNNLSGNITIRSEEIRSATDTFTKLLYHIKELLPPTLQK